MKGLNQNLRSVYKIKKKISLSRPFLAENEAIEAN